MRRMQIAVVVLICLVIGVACLDIFGSTAKHWQVVIYNALYSLLASLLASTIVSWVIFQQRIRDRQQQNQLTLALLGLAPPEPTHQVVIVVPAFPLPLKEDRLREFRLSERARNMLERVPANIIKDWDEIHNYAYARRDMLLALDIERVLAVAGLPPPYVLSDYEFLQALHDAAGNDEGSSAFRIRTEKHVRNQPSDITHVILIGLWSNLATMLLQGDQRVPIEILGAGDEREFRLLIPDSDGYMLSSSTGTKGRAVRGSEDLPQALVAKFHLPEVCIAILGGTSALGTARLGDFILHRAAEFKKLSEADVSDDIWLGVKCPPTKMRDDPYVLWCCEPHSRYLAQQKTEPGVRHLFGVRRPPFNSIVGH